MRSARAAAVAIVVMGTLELAMGTASRRGIEPACAEKALAVLMTREEKLIYQGLETEQQRLRFQKIFWARRDPSPGTLAKELKMEFERRVEIAERRFGTMGRCGVATDRGKVYLLMGPPERTEPSSPRESSLSSEPAGAAGIDGAGREIEEGVDVPREPEMRDVTPRRDPFRREGTALKDSRAVETWVYPRHDAGAAGNELRLRFVERGALGYRLIQDPIVEDALERARRSYIVAPDVEYFSEGQTLRPQPRSSFQEQEEEENLIAVLRTLPGGAKDISFQVKPFFFRAASGAVFTALVFDIDRAALSWKDGHARVTIAGVVENDVGDTVRSFHESSTLAAGPGGRAVFEMPLELESGLYRFRLGVRDDATSKLGERTLHLKVPGLSGGELKLSTVLLFTEGDKTDEQVGRPGRAFIMGGFHFVPKLDRVYTTEEHLAGLVAAYGFDKKDGQPRLTAQCIFLTDGKTNGRTAEEPFLSAGSDMAMTIFDVLLSSLAPGAHTLRLKVTDHIGGTIVTRDIPFVLQRAGGETR